MRGFFLSDANEYISDSIYLNQHEKYLRLTLKPRAARNVMECYNKPNDFYDNNKSYTLYCAIVIVSLLLLLLSS